MTPINVEAVFRLKLSIVNMRVNELAFTLHLKEEVKNLTLITEKYFRYYLLQN